jgi:hypothetical protein
MILHDTARKTFTAEDAEVRRGRRGRRERQKLVRFFQTMIVAGGEDFGLKNTPPGFLFSLRPLRTSASSAVKGLACGPVALPILSSRIVQRAGYSRCAVLEHSSTIL